MVKGRYGLEAELHRSLIHGANLKAVVSIPNSADAASFGELPPSMLMASPVM